MQIGTKSILFGAHQFLIHPAMLLRAWRLLYGFPFDPRIWVAAFVHDWGYWSKPNMDGPEGESHPELGAAIVRRLFGDDWGDFTLCHSRFYAKKQGRTISRLCVADKYSVVVVPAWLYVPMVRLTGEIRLYRAVGTRTGEDPVWVDLARDVGTDWEWFAALKEYMVKVVEGSRRTALSVDDIRRERQVDHYVGIFGEEHRQSIRHGLTYLRSKERMMGVRLNPDVFVKNICS